MIWRPKDWKKFKIKANPLHCLAPVECTNFAYEAGADAMFKALKKSGTHGYLFDDSILTPDGHVVGLQGYDGNSNGTFVFIPD